MLYLDVALEVVSVGVCEQNPGFSECRGEEGLELDGAHSKEFIQVVGVVIIHVEGDFIQRHVRLQLCLVVPLRVACVVADASGILVVAHFHDASSWMLYMYGDG